jgi:predicted Rossmann-fold nucleotide-binding protein
MINDPNFNEINSIVAYLRRVPYNIAPKCLYDGYSLYKGYVPGDDESFKTCFDSMVYKHFLEKGKMTRGVEESLARALHDHGMHIALNDFFNKYDSRCCVGVMGGHALKRNDEMYRTIVILSKNLTELGFYMISGGGPGAMEATHLGAWMAGRSMDETDDAISILAQSTSFDDSKWMSTAFQVMEKYPQSQYVSLGIPTWLYGHEPSTPLATHIAKFFDNSIREDSILTLAYGGIIYAPGSAGTMQEIFQEAVQNHYLSFGFSSPMIFLGKKFWTEEMPAYPLLEGLIETGKYKNLRLTLTDDSNQVVKALQDFRQELLASCGNN